MIYFDHLARAVMDAAIDREVIRVADELLEVIGEEYISEEDEAFTAEILSRNQICLCWNYLVRVREALAAPPGVRMWGLGTVAARSLCFLVDGDVDRDARPYTMFLRDATQGDLEESFVKMSYDEVVSKVDMIREWIGKTYGEEWIGRTYGNSDLDPD